MWLFTKVGFFSVVQVHDLQGAVMIRARVLEDIELLLKTYKKQFKVNGRIVQTPTNDYPYRIHVRQTEFAKLCAALAKDIDYTNFKSKVEDDRGRDVEELYMRVWQTMVNAEKKLKQIAGERRVDPLGTAGMPRL